MRIDAEKRANAAKFDLADDSLSTKRFYLTSRKGKAFLRLKALSERFKTIPEISSNGKMFSVKF